MVSPLFEPSLREQQVAMSLLAHIARHDRDAVAASLAVMVDQAAPVRPLAVVAALLDQFELGIGDTDGHALAAWFSSQAQVLAAREHAA